MKRVLAVDLGGTKTATAIVDSHALITRKQKTPAAHDAAATVEQIAAAAQGYAIDGVGVIVPGIFNPASGQAWAPNLWGRDWIPLKAMLEDRLRLPISIGSDRAGAVLGEHWQGIAQGRQDVIFVAVGTGIGVGILAGGRVWEGAHGTAGSAGWMSLDLRWRPEYERTGCWESLAAGPALARRAGAASAEQLVVNARQGSQAAPEQLREAGRTLGVGIANLISLFDPEIVVLGGGLMAAAGDLL
ncbi:MAG: ROK family protein, partial [Bryobacterales bacterium]|nr:ROK family protein [Bryobacterales bacterium]